MAGLVGIFYLIIEFTCFGPKRSRYTCFWPLPAKKQHTEHPRQHVAVVDNVHCTAVSSMSTRLGDSMLIEGNEKKPTGPSFGFSVEYVSLQKRTCVRLALLQEQVIQHFRCSPTIEYRCRRPESHRDLNIILFLVWNIGVADVTKPSVYSWNYFFFVTMTFPRVFTETYYRRGSNHTSTA